MEGITVELREKFKELCNRFTVDQLNSGITFILIPRTGEKQTKTEMILNDQNIDVLFKEIKRNYPNRASYFTKIHFTKIIESENSFTKEKIISEIPAEISEKKKSPDVILRTFQEHQSIKKELNAQTLEIELSFETKKMAKLYIVSKDVGSFNEELLKKTENLWEKIYSKDDYYLEICYLNTYENNITIEENQIIHIIVDEVFMNDVCQNENQKAKSICILADPSNTHAADLQKKYKKIITKISKKIDVLVSKNNFNPK